MQSARLEASCVAVLSGRLMSNDCVMKASLEDDVQYRVRLGFLLFLGLGPVFSGLDFAFPRLTLQGSHLIRGEAAPLTRLKAAQVQRSECFPSGHQQPPPGQVGE